VDASHAKIFAERTMTCGGRRSRSVATSS
jgi:hypothetical protein